MEKLIINDLSIKRSGVSCEVLKGQLLQIVNLVAVNKKARSMIRCSRSTVSQILFNELSLIEFAASFPRDDKIRVLTWLSNTGPFWDDGRTEVDLDYFTFKNVDVTEQGLGELGRMHSTGVMSAAFSFQDSEPDMYVRTLPVLHGIEEILIGNYDIPNFWDADEFLDFIESAALSELDSWRKMVEVATDSFDALNISEDAISGLLSTPFTMCAAKKIMSLLRVLNEIVKNTDQLGARNDKAQRMINCHFIGDNADFSDESERNKSDFRGALTFRNSNGEKFFAPWHGKVNTPKLRVHFEWPLRQGNSKLDVYYIGPKLTKR